MSEDVFEKGCDEGSHVSIEQFGRQRVHEPAQLQWVQEFAAGDRGLLFDFAPDAPSHIDFRNVVRSGAAGWKAGRSVYG